MANNTYKKACARIIRALIGALDRLRLLMLRRFYKRYIPSHHLIREHKHLRMFGTRLHDPNLWHLNRRSAAGAMGTGVFVAFIPIPGQMIIAAAAAIWLRVNLPLAVAMVWITNPFTMTPIFYSTYKVGTWMLGSKPRSFAFELSLSWLLERIETVGLPLLVGSLTIGLLSGALVYVSVRIAWRLYVIHRKRRRSARRV